MNIRVLFDTGRQDNRRVYKQVTSAQLDELTRSAVDLELRDSGRITLLTLIGTAPLLAAKLIVNLRPFRALEVQRQSR